LRRERQLSVPAALRIVSQVLKALIPAHAAGIVHRDLKPDNVFLCARDDDPSFVKIVDFGISKVARVRSADTLTRQGTVLGTAFYMSPEQAQSYADIDARTDLFSVGAILFEMLSGQPPHAGGSYEAVLIAICTHDAVDVRTRTPDVPAAVAAIVSRALDRDRERRFQSAGEFLAAITDLELAVTPDGSLAVAPDAPAVAERARRGATLPPRRRFGTLVLGILASLAGFALTAYLVARGNAAPSVRRDSAPRPSASPLPLAPAERSLPVVASASTAPPLPAAPAPIPDRPRRAPAARPAPHIASGLTLSTKEP